MILRATTNAGGTATLQQPAADWRRQALRMSDAGHAELSALFEQLAQEDETARANGHGGPATTLDLEGMDAVSPDLLDRYAILSVAVRAAMREFSGWSYRAAYAEAPAARAEAEAVAMRFLDLAKGRRRLRRAAYRARQGAMQAETASLSLARLEEHLAGLVDCAERDEDDADGQICAAIVTEARKWAGELAMVPPVMVSGVPAQVLGNPVVLVEAIADCYLSAVDGQEDPVLLRLFQKGARSAIARLEQLRRVRQPQGPSMA